jgi:hypothetical protein
MPQHIYQGSGNGWLCQATQRTTGVIWYNPDGKDAKELKEDNACRHCDANVFGFKEVASQEELKMGIRVGCKIRDDHTYKKFFYTRSEE